jgi:hypothetical protein
MNVDRFPRSEAVELIWAFVQLLFLAAQLAMKAG